MNCEICGIRIPIKFGIIAHKLIEHKINANGGKISKLFQLFQTEDVLNSSDSECEYHFKLSVQRVPKIKKAQPVKNNTNNYADFDYVEKTESDEYLDDNKSTIFDDYDDTVDEDSSEDTFNYQCYLCKEQYDALKLLQGHFKRLHGSVGKRKPIRRRIKEGVKQNELKSDKLFCKRCSTLFMDNFEIQQHRNDGKCKPLQRPTTLLCTYCGKVFAHETSYRCHVRRHENYRPYKCDICIGVGYPEKAALMKHMNKHTGENRYICPIEGCHSEFTYKGSLKLHQINVHGPKEHKCPYCDKMFSNKNRIADHIRGHTGEKPFRCELCFRAFAKKSKCWEHKKTHTGAKPYKCKICQKGYTTPQNLRTHNKTVKCKLPESTASN